MEHSLARINRVLDQIARDAGMDIEDLHFWAREFVRAKLAPGRDDRALPPSETIIEHVSKDDVPPWSE